MTRLGYIKRTPLRSKKKEPRVERIPLAIPRPNEVKKEIEVEHTFRDGRTKINQNCKEGRDLYQRRKRDAWEKQGRLCSICHLHLNWADSTVDHIKPRKTGGSEHDDRQENIAAAHGTCNCERGSKRKGFYDVP